MKTTQITLFGKLKKWAPKGSIEVAIHSEMNPRLLKEAVAAELKKMNSSFLGISELLSSAIANESRILQEDELLGNSNEFSLLPPVCGG